MFELCMKPKVYLGKAVKEEERRKFKKIKGQRSTHLDSHLLVGHLIVQGLEVVVAEVPLGHGEHIQCLEGGENAALQLQQAKGQLNNISIKISNKITICQLHGHTYNGFSLLRRSSVSTTMAIIMCIVMNCKESRELKFPMLSTPTPSLPFPYSPA